MHRTNTAILRMAIACFAILPLLPVGAADSLSATSRKNIAGAGASFQPSFSADGRHVVFVSFANNLVTNDSFLPYLDVFVRDLASSNTTLVSVNSSGLGGGNDNSGAPTISSNAQFAAFESAATDLVAGKTNGIADVFLRDLAAGTTALVSVHSSLNSFDKGASTTPLVSADGRWVVFESAASDLVTNQTGTNNIYARDMTAGATVLVSVDLSGVSGGSGASDSPNMTPDARRISFVSASTNLAASAVGPSQGDVYVRDRQAGRTYWASTNLPNLLAGYTRSMNPVMSADGGFVFFQAIGNSTNLYRFDLQNNATSLLDSNVQAFAAASVSADGKFAAYEKDNSVYVWDALSGTIILASVTTNGSRMTNGLGSSQPVISPDGSKVLFLATLGVMTNSFSQLYFRDLAAATTRLVSQTTNGSTSADLTSILPNISPDGNLVAFDSLSDQLVADDLNQASDVFVRDLTASVTHLVSQHHPSLPAVSGIALCGLFPNAISADGRFVVFSSLDNNLVPGDTNGFQDIFVRDLTSGSIVPVSLGLGGGLTNQLNAHDPAISANGQFVAYTLGSTQSIFIPTLNSVFRRDLQNGVTEAVLPGHAVSVPSISGDGRLVVFQSSDNASSFVSGVSDANSGFDVFLRDMVAGTNQVISLNSNGVATGNSGSSNSFLSPDARWVLFSSTASSLATNSTGGILSLFARDLLSNTTQVVSTGPDGNPQWGFAGKAAISPDSRYAAFVSINYGILVRDLLARTSIVVCANCDNPSISSGGRFVAYETPLTGGPRNIVLKDMQTGATNLISVNRLGNGGGNGSSTSPLLSGDGRFVVFRSQASDLVDNDTNNAADIFVRDRLQGATLLASLNRSGSGPGNAVSSQPVLGPDGRTVAFQSLASDLISGDYNSKRDVFVLRLASNDSDNDGMDDDWEMAYFGNLSRDGSGDFDGDGTTDLQEFLAGTNPTSSGSILRALTVTAINSGNVTVLWSAQPGKRYLVQFKNGLNDSQWSNLGDIVRAATTTGALPDPSPAPTQRFYRVLLMP